MWLVRVLMIICYPIAYPIGKVVFVFLSPQLVHGGWSSPVFLFGTCCTLLWIIFSCGICDNISGHSGQGTIKEMQIFRCCWYQRVLLIFMSAQNDMCNTFNSVPLLALHVDFYPKKEKLYCM